MVDDIAAAGATEQVADGEAMDHAGRRMDAAHRIVGGEGIAFPVEIEEAASGIDRAILEEVEEAFRLFYQPLAVPGQRAPIGFRAFRLGHLIPLALVLSLMAPR